MFKSLTKTAPPNLSLAPSDRDLQIYKAIALLHRDQVFVAANYNLSQARVSQILNQVRRWLAAGGSPTDPDICDHIAQQNLAKAQNRLRLMRIIDKATHAAEGQLGSQKVTKTRYHGTTAVWHEETSVMAPEVNLPALRLLLRAVKSLDELECRPDAAPPPSANPPLTKEQLLQSVLQLLCTWRFRAEAAGHVPHSDDVPRLVADTLRSLLGATFDPAIEMEDASPSAPYMPAGISAPSDLLVAPTPDPEPLSHDSSPSLETKK